MSGVCVPDNLRITPQAAFETAATVVIDEDTIAPTAVHRELFHPAQSDLPAHLQESLAALPPVRGGQFALAETLRANGVTALDGLYARSAAKACRHLQHASSPDNGPHHWLRFLHLTRHWGRPEADYTAPLDDLSAGPVALLAQRETTPTITVEISSSFVSDFAQQQRERLLAYLRSLTPGVCVRLTGSRLALRRLLEHHEADLPSEVAERAWSQLQVQGETQRRPPAQQAADAVASIGVGERQAGYWRLLAHVCDSSDATVQQAALEDNTLFEDVSPSGLRHRAGRLEECGLLERPRRNGQVHLRPTAAGQAALTQVREEAPALVGGWDTGDTPTSESSDSAGQTADVSDPPKSTLELCYPNEQEEYGEPNRPTAEGSAATAGQSTSLPETRYLDLHEHHATSATAPNSGGIALESRSLNTSIDDRRVGWSLDDARDEVVLEATAAPTMALTALRMCSAALNPKAEKEVLNAEKLNDGPGRYNLEGLIIDNPYVLRKGRTLGWLRDVDAEGGRFLDRLRTARNALFEEYAELADSTDDAYDSDTLSDLLSRAHGLLGVLVAVYDLLGFDVVRKLRVPRPDHIDEQALGKFLTKQLSITSRYGAYTAHRVLHEPREEKRDDALGAPTVDDQDPVGTVTGSWVVEGPCVDQFRDALSKAVNNPEDSHLALQEDKKNFAPFVLDLDVVDGHRRDAVAGVVARMCRFKNLERTQTMVSLLHSMTGNTAAVAEALSYLGASESGRELDHGDLEYGLSQLPAGEILPDIGSSTVSSVISTLLNREACESTMALAEAADVSAQSIRDNLETFEQLEELGLLDLCEGEPGTPTSWEFSFPAAGTDAGHNVSEDGSSKSLLNAVLGSAPWGESEWRLEEAVFEYLTTLTDERKQSLSIEWDGDAAMQAWTVPPDSRDIQPFVVTHPQLHPLLSVLTRLAGSRLPIGDSPMSLQLGKTPTSTLEQQQLPTAIAD